MPITGYYTIDDRVNALNGDFSLLKSNLDAAIAAWSRVFAGTARADVTVIILDQTPSGRADGSFSNGTYVKGTSIIDGATSNQLRTGIDVNGTKSDVQIRFSKEYLLNNEWFDPTPFDNGKDIPSNKVDVVSVLTHEIGHALGFIGWRDWSTGLNSFSYGSPFDQNVVTRDGLSYFYGENVAALYPGGVPLTKDNLFHLGNRSPLPGSELIPDLMNGVVYYPGSRYSPSEVDLAVYADLGIGTIRSDILDPRKYTSEAAITVNGGSGTDTFVVSGARSAYQVSYSAAAGGYKITGNGQSDTLLSIESIRFSDGKVWIEQAAGLNNGVHRFYNTQTGTHVMTGSNEEAYAIRTNASYINDEGFAFASGKTGTAVDVYRFFNVNTKAYFYTLSTDERDNVIANYSQFRYEGSTFKAYNQSGGTQEELYRFYNVSTGAHFFTTSEAERDQVMATYPQFKYEGVGFYVDILG